jgi:hypothetical protein
MRFQPRSSFLLQKSTIMDAKVDDVLEEKINPAKGKCQKSMS